MPPTRRYYVYIMASRSGVLYAGATSDLHRRVYQHRNRLLVGFTCKYQVTRLGYFDETPDARAAVTRERQIKSWRREKKIRLIEEMNPSWCDLAENWYPKPDK